MYKNKATKNIITSLVFKTILLIIGLISRRYMVNLLGQEITGIYSLFVSVLGFLAVAELGIGSAIVFSMYKPISEKDINKTSALYYLYKKIYMYIFIIIITLGLIVTPFLPVLAKDNTIGNALYITYIVFLVSTSITYLYAYKTSFINAHMDNYITNSIRSVFQILELGIQILIIIYTRSFFWFLVIHFISNVSQGLFTHIIFNRRYKDKVNNNKAVPEELRTQVVKQTKAMFFHKIGGLLVNTTDSIIISAFISVSILGIYSNYVLIVTTMIGVFGLIFTSSVTVLGHAFSNYSKEVLNQQYQKFYLLNFLLGTVLFLGFYAISNELITILFNENVLLPNNIVIILTINYFIQFMRYTTLSFRDASGTFYNDRYKPLFEGITNLILSLVFVQFWGINGVLVATIITNLSITHTVEPYVLYKYGFERNPKKYYLFNYFGILLFVLLIFAFTYIPLPFIDNIYLSLLAKGFTSVGLWISVVVVLYLSSKTFRKNMKLLIKEATKFLTKKRKQH